MLPGMEMLACPNLAVSAEVMQHIVQVESSDNPYAIGVVGGQLQRQPRNLPEALATVRMLNTQGYNFSIGLAQVNRANLSRYGLDSYEKAFNACANLSAGARILADCYSSAQGNWGKAFSCYYSGNFTSGFRDGYVQKVYASINSEVGATGAQIPPYPMPPLTKQSSHQRAQSSSPAFPTPLATVTVAASGSDYRVALRSTAIDELAAATVGAIASAPFPRSPEVESTAGAASLAAIGNVAAMGETVPDVAKINASKDSSVIGRLHMSPDASDDNDVFVPQVRGPRDLADPYISTGAKQASAEIPTLTDSTNGTDLDQEHSDAAFVF